MSVVTLVNCFDVPRGHEDGFFALWRQVNTSVRSDRYLGHKLHRSLAPDARFRFINVAQWASTQDFRAAHDDGFRALVSQPAWAPYSSTPCIVRSRTPK